MLTKSPKKETHVFEPNCRSHQSWSNPVFVTCREWEPAVAPGAASARLGGGPYVATTPFIERPQKTLLCSLCPVRLKIKCPSDVQPIIQMLERR